MSSTRSMPEIGIAMVGYGFMGRAHSQALRNVSAAFELPLQPRMVSLAGRNEAQVSETADRLGWDGYNTDWQSVVARDDVDLVIVGTPGNTHAEIAIGALNAGKHVLCEKPLANTIAEAEAMVAAADAARANGVRAMLVHNYRRVPAIEVARSMISAGEIGEVLQVRSSYQQDWLVDPRAPMSWRLRAEDAGTGALGDIGSHAIDLAQHVSGQRLVNVSALLATMVKERPTDGGASTDTVTVDDIALFHGEMSGGAVAAFEATRMATGRKNALRLEVHGTNGAIGFDLERLNELQVLRSPKGDTGFERLLVTEDSHPWLEGWWPPGHVIGWEHTFTHQLRDLLTHIADGTDPSPSFAEGLALVRTLAAVSESADSGRRVSI